MRTTATHTARGRGRGPAALVLGGFDVVRPLLLAGVRCWVTADPRDPIRFSRHIAGRTRWADPEEDPDGAIEALLEFAAGQAERPVLFVPNDRWLFLVSARRAQLAPHVRLRLAPHALICDLADKAAFRRLAEALDLGVPASWELGTPPPPGARFPVVVKPLRHSARWHTYFGGGKAVRADDEDALRALATTFAAIEVPALVQELVPGPESRIESFHAYSTPEHGVLGEFTGRKVRTFPVAHGASTAVEITWEPDVACRGREVLARLALHGPAKVDFKRDPAGELRLLEVNPRFNLWHHPAALAGVNLPALAYDELTGACPAPAGRVVPGTRWCDPLLDLRAVRAGGRRSTHWLADAVRTDAFSGFAADDPLPLLRGTVSPAVRRRGRRVRVALQRRHGRAA